MRTALLVVCLAVEAAAFQLGRAPGTGVRTQRAPQMAQKPQSAVAGALATSLALALASSQPALTQAAVEPPAVVRAARVSTTKRLPLLPAFLHLTHAPRAFFPGNRRCSSMAAP